MKCTCHPVRGIHAVFCKGYLPCGHSHSNLRSTANDPKCKSVAAYCAACAFNAKFIEKRGNCNVYAMECLCGTVGEIGVPKHKMNALFEHDLCGALLIQKPGSGMFGKPKLVMVSAGNRG